MKWWLVFFIGFSLGSYCNSETGEKHGYMVGRWMRNQMIKYDVLPKAWGKKDE
jgi:hypothetical protein